MIVYHFLEIFDITISLFSAVILSDIVYQNRAVFDFKTIISFFDEFFEKYAIFDQFGFNLQKKIAKMNISKLKAEMGQFLKLMSPFYYF
jgi:hypothetical protein